MAEPAIVFSVTLVAFYTRCAEVTCPIAVWTERAAGLAALVADAEGGKGAVDVFSNCPQATRQSELAPNGVTIRVHADVDPRLRRALEFAPCIPKQRIYLLKWAIFAIEGTEFVFFADLDVLPLTPQQVRNAPIIVEDWCALMQRMRERNLSLVSEADGSSPLNAGILLLRPDRQIYESGLTVLAKANASYNTTHGFELAGPPGSVIPMDDPVRSPAAHPSAKNLLKRNVWRFYGSASDQGFFFYMLRVKHQRGADVPLRLPKRYRRTVRWCIPHCQSKPYLHLPQSPRCMGVRSERGTPKYSFAQDQVAARQVRWATDALADVRDGCGPNVGNVLFKRAELLQCERQFRGAIECRYQKAAKWSTSNMTRELWDALVESMPIEQLFTNKKCAPATPNGTLFFAKAGMRRLRRERRARRALQVRIVDN
jgi:hypothetical protein